MHVVITSTIVSVIQLKLYILISSFLYILRVSFTNDEVYVLKEQGAKDQGCYNYLKDIMRIEEFRDKSNNFIEGYTIKITSEISYLKPPTKVNCTYAEFSIEDGSIKTGCMNWAANTGKGTMRGMETPIVLTGIYPINWKEYSKVDDTNSGTFIYLVNRISK